jgi:hypothetical protein
MVEERDDDDARRRDEEISRYRLAAEETLEQLEWCVNYLHRIRKSSIADVIDKNRRQIRRQMRGPSP